MINKDTGNNNTIVKDELKRCDPPSFLHSINFLLDNASKTNVSFIEDIWPSLQLRYKYCKNAHDSEFIPDVYKWISKKTIPTPFESTFKDKNKGNEV